VYSYNLQELHYNRTICPYGIVLPFCILFVSCMIVYPHFCNTKSTPEIDLLLSVVGDPQIEDTILDIFHQVFHYAL
jgi:hypothetical protein